MKAPSFFSLGMIWIAAAIISFTLFMNTRDGGALVRCGVFLMAGMLYLWADWRRKRKKK